MELTNHLKPKKFRLRKQYLNLSEDEELEIIGYKKDEIKGKLLWILYVLSIGMLNLLFYWYPKWKLICTHKKCFLDEAETLLFINIYQKVFKSYYVENIQVLNFQDESNEISTKVKIHVGGGEEKEFTQIKTVYHKKTCYVWSSDEGKFVILLGYDHEIKHIDYYNLKGFSRVEQDSRRIIYNKNEIEIPSKSASTLILEEILTPFYIFQMISLIIWLIEAYYYYTIAIFVMSVIGVTFSVIESKKNQKSLRKTVHATDEVTVRRCNGNLEKIQSNLLVPGDIIVIPKEGGLLYCDAVLLNGNCIVNEGMLTGESVPVTKTPLAKDHKCYNLKDDSHHTLFCGTKIIQTRSKGEVFAVVLRTGFQTTKGQLVRTILYPPPSDFKFDQDSYKFIGVLSFIALIGFIYTIVSKSYRGLPSTEIAAKALDIITIVVPPALPAALTVGKLYALFRLKKGNIFCTNSGDINVSGSLNCICFDKTGTLTEDGLDMFGVVISENGKLQDIVKDVRSIYKQEEIIKGMVSCHSLTLIDGEVKGDPLDLKMFESSGWILYEKKQFDDEDISVLPIAKPPQNHRKVSCLSLSGNKNFAASVSQEIEILRQFHFSSKLQRMSVITREKGLDNYVLYCKGAPEKILSLSIPESIPKDVNGKLNFYTQQGYRVIAMGKRVLEDSESKDISGLIRENMEKNLKFIGFIIFENKLKPETKEIINVLKEANFKILMITGDNALTALSVARECEIIEKDQPVVNIDVINIKETNEYKLVYDSIYHPKQDGLDNIILDQTVIKMGTKRDNYCFTLTGNTWSLLRKYFPEELQSIVLNGVVFARMTSDHKQQLVQELKMSGFYVGMCGDGANDVGALKAAHVGISLSEEESSVAAPFTSKIPNISCVVKVIKEGRAALVTTLGIFKFMVCYSLAEFTSVIILYGVDSNLTSFQFLFVDLFLVFIFESVFGKTKAYKGPLSKTPPKSSLLGITPLLSISLQIFLIALFQIIAFLVIQRFPWFTPYVYNPHNPYNFKSYENYAVFCSSMFQYITIAIVFSKGKPYRQPLYTNKLFFIILLVSGAICSYITLSPSRMLRRQFELLIPPAYDGRVMILAISLVHFIVALIAEDIFVEKLLDGKILPHLNRIRNFQKSFITFREDDHLRTSNLEEVNVHGKDKAGLQGSSNLGFVTNL